MALPPMFDGCSIADGDKPSGKARLVRAGVSDRGFLIFRRGGPCSVFGELETTIAQGGSPFGALSRRRLEVVAGNVRYCIDFMSGKRLIFPLRRGARGLGLVPASAIFSGSLFVFGVAIWPPARAISQTGWPGGASLMTAICAR